MTSKLLISYTVRLNIMKILKFTLSLLLYMLKINKLTTITDTFLSQSVFEKRKSTIILYLRNRTPQINCCYFFQLVVYVVYQADCPFVFCVDDSTTVRLSSCQHSTQLGEIWNMEMSAAGLATKNNYSLVKPNCCRMLCRLKPTPSLCNTPVKY